MNSKQQKILDKLIKSKPKDTAHGKYAADRWEEEINKKLKNDGANGKTPFKMTVIMRKVFNAMNLAQVTGGRTKDAISQFNAWVQTPQVGKELKKDGNNKCKIFLKYALEKFNNSPAYKWDSNKMMFIIPEEITKTEAPKDADTAKKDDGESSVIKIDDSVSESLDLNNAPDPAVTTYKPTSLADVKESLSKINDVDPETRIMMLRANDTYLKNNNSNAADYDDVVKKNDEMMESSMWECESDDFKTLASKYINGDISSNTLAKTVVPSPTPELKKMLEKETKKETKKEGDLDIDDLKTDKPLEKKELDTPAPTPTKKFKRVGDVTKLLKAGQGDSTDAEYRAELQEALDFCEAWRSKYKKNKENKANENRIKRLRTRISVLDQRSMRSEMSVSTVNDAGKTEVKSSPEKLKEVEDITDELKRQLIFKLSYWNNPEIVNGGAEEKKTAAGHRYIADTAEKRRKALIQPVLMEAMTKLKAVGLTGDEFRNAKYNMVKTMNDTFFRDGNEYGFRFSVRNPNNKFIEIRNNKAKSDKNKAEKGYYNQNAPNKDTFFQYNMGDIFDIIENYVGDDDMKFTLSEHAKDQIENIINTTVEQYKKKAEYQGMVHHTVAHGKAEQHLIKLIEKYINSRKNARITMKFELPADAATKIIEIVKREEDKYLRKVDDMKHQNKQKSKNILAKINNLFYR